MSVVHAFSQTTLGKRGSPSENSLNLALGIRTLPTVKTRSGINGLLPVDWTIIGNSKELNIHGAHLGPRCYPVAIRMIEEGDPPMDKIVTHRLPLSDYQQGIDMMLSGLTSLRVTLEPSSWERRQPPGLR